MSTVSGESGELVCFDTTQLDVRGAAASNEAAADEDRDMMCSPESGAGTASASSSPAVTSIEEASHESHASAGLSERYVGGAWAASGHHHHPGPRHPSRSAGGAAEPPTLPRALSRSSSGGELLTAGGGYSLGSRLGTAGGSCWDGTPRPGCGRVADATATSEDGDSEGVGGLMSTSAWSHRGREEDGRGTLTRSTSQQQQRGARVAPLGDAAQVPAPAWSMMALPQWPTPCMPYGQIPGMPGMQYMVAPSGPMPMPYPYVPYTGHAAPGFMYPPPAPAVPGGLVQPANVASAPLPMFMCPPPAPLAPWTAGGVGDASAHHWSPVPYPFYTSAQGGAASNARLHASASTPNIGSPSSGPKPSSVKSSRQRGRRGGGGGTGTGSSSGAATTTRLPTSTSGDGPPLQRRGDTSSSGAATTRSPASGSGGPPPPQQQRPGRLDSSETASSSTGNTFGTVPCGGVYQRGCNSVGGSSGIMRPASSGGASGEERARHLATLYVGNLAPGVEECHLYSAFIQFGLITNVQVIRQLSSGVCKGYGFVSFRHPPSATMALQHMNGVNLMGPFQGRAIKVSRYTKANFKDVAKSLVPWPLPQPLVSHPEVLNA